jgi:excisionase family DNA binding protein
MTTNIETNTNCTGNAAGLQPLLYDIQQSAQVLNVSTKTVRRLLARRKLTSCNVLRKVLIPRDQLTAFMKATCDKPDFQI